MEYQGKARKMMVIKDKFFDMDLSDWCKQSAKEGGKGVCRGALANFE
jgi:hypothetical protein